MSSLLEICTVCFFYLLNHSRLFQEVLSTPRLLAQASAVVKTMLITVISYHNDLQTTDTETSVELNFAVLKFKHTVKKAADKK